MIGDLSESLENILRQGQYQYINASNEAVELKDFDVSFAHPSTLVKPDRTTFNLFLFDIRENTVLKTGTTGAPRYEKSEDGQIRAVPPYILVSCSYFVTVWPHVEGDRVLNEQRLLSQILQVFASSPVIPENMLVGQLENEDIPLPSVTLLNDLSERSLFDLWPLLKVDMRAAFTMTVTASMPLSFPDLDGQDTYPVQTVNTLIL